MAQCGLGADEIGAEGHIPSSDKTFPLFSMHDEMVATVGNCAVLATVLGAHFFALIDLYLSFLVLFSIASTGESPMGILWPLPMKQERRS